MADPIFEEFFKLLLRLEGGYQTYDKAGETKYGITRATLKAYLQKHKLPDKNIKDLTVQDAHDIYYAEFFVHIEPAKNLEVYYNLFDLCVNSGFPAYMRCDSTIDENDPESVYRWRKLFLKKIVINSPSQKQYFGGWLNRLDEIKEYFQKRK